MATTIKDLELKLKAVKKKQSALDDVMPHVSTGIIIDLDGPEGNVFYILGLCSRLARDYLDEQEAEQFNKDVQHQKYEQILAACQKWFGLIYITKEDKK